MMMQTPSGTLRINILLPFTRIIWPKSLCLILLVNIQFLFKIKNKGKSYTLYMIHILKSLDF